MSTITKKTFLIGLDIGTSAIKGVLVDRGGIVLAETEKNITFIHSQPDLCEISPVQHYQDVCGVIRKLSAAAPFPVTALAMAAASGNTLLADSSGQPLTNIISWLDRREKQAKTATLKQFSSEDVRQITGWPCVDIFPLAHLAWLRENRQELYESAGHYCMNTDWLLFRLTGKWVMDYSTATTFHLQDQCRQCWHQPFLGMLDIPAGKLSHLTDSGKPAGSLTLQAARDTGLAVNTPVITGCFDHPAAARSAGVLEPGQLLLSCGTSWVGFFPELERQKIIDLELLCDPFLSNRGGPWGAIFSIPYIGRTIDAYIDNYIAPGETDKYRIFNELAMVAKPGADGLKIDLREPPRWIEAERRDISRAVMEGAAELLNAKLNHLKEHGINFKKAVMTGGPSHSPVWPQIVAATTALEIVTGSRHAGAKGAALLSGIGSRIYRDEYDAYKTAGDHYGC
jgi:xylulokinase